MEEDMAEDKKTKEVIPAKERYAEEIEFVKKHGTIDEKGVEVDHKASTTYFEQNCGISKENQVAYRAGKGRLFAGALVVAQEGHLKKMQAAKEAGDDLSAVRTTAKVITGSTSPKDVRSVSTGTIYGQTTSRNPTTGETKTNACAIRLNCKEATGIKKDLAEEFGREGMPIIEGDA